MITLFLVVAAISLLILVHEWGHFSSARMLGVKVEEFGFGFPPRLFSRMKNGIRYSFNLLPFGGFVKIFGERGEGEGESESFISRPPWQRFIILFAGVGMNFVLAWMFFSAGASIGIPYLADDGEEPEIPVSILAVMPNSPAEASGMRLGDVIQELRFAGESVFPRTEQEVSDFVRGHGGAEVTVLLARGGDVREIRVVPRANVPETEGPLGIALGRISVRTVPLYAAPWEGAKMLFRSVWATVDGFVMIVTELVQGHTDVPLSGPIGIYFFAEDTRTLGFSYFLVFIGNLSVSLAILNFLPIPALDGGRIFFLAVEKLKGSRISPGFENVLHAFGFVFLIALMVLVTYRDIVTWIL